MAAACNVVTGADDIDLGDGDDAAGGGQAKTGAGPGAVGPGGGGPGTGGAGPGGARPSGAGGGGDSSPFATCGNGGPVGEHQLVTLASGEYYVWAPAPAAEPHPLVVALHGDEGHPDKAVSFIWGGVWKAHKDFILVAPRCPSAQGSWWQGDTAGYATFVDAVLEDVAQSHNVDIARAYAVGYSGGSCWLSGYAFQFQDVFAAVQWTCGGCNPKVLAPPKPECKIDGRFHIAADDFLLQGAQATSKAMQDKGHEVEFVTASCSGHCCMNSPADAEAALAWFLARTKCDTTNGEGCGKITDLP
jgi:predicted esterase